MAVLLSGTTIGGNAAIHAGNISTYALTSIPATISPTNIYVGNAIYFGGANNYFNWDGARINSNVGIQSAVDMRAPIFYDSADTGYYVDPNSTSVLNNLWLKNGGNNSYSPRWDLSAYVLESQHWYAHTSTQSMYLGEENTVYVRSTGIASESFRAPIFYDSNDTNYYVDPNSTSVLNRVYTTGRLEVTYNTDRYQMNFLRNSGSNWWVTNDSSNLGLHVNNVGDRFYFSTGGDFYSDANGWLSTALAAKQNASTAITTSNIGSQSVSYASSAGSAGTSTHTYRGIIEDTRAAQRTPNAYEDYRVSWEFTNQMPHDSNWLSVMTMQGWHDGYAAWQIMGTATTTAFENWYLRSGVNGTWNTARTIIHSGNIGSQSVSYATSAGNSVSTDQTNFSALFIEDAPVATKEFVTSQGYLTSLPSHTHDDRYLVKGGSWYGSGLPGSRWGGFSVSGGEIVFGDGLPNAGQMGILIDGAYLAGENNGFWSLASDNSWGSRRGMYWDGTYLNFTTNTPPALFSDVRAPIFYDSNDTTYYLDPNSTSRIVNLWARGANSYDGYIYVGGSSAGNGMTINYDQIWTGSGNLHLQYSSSGNIDMNYGGGYTFSRTSLRAPIFYDYNDTAFYVDPNSNSRLVSLNLSNGQVNAANNAGGRLRISSYTNGENLITGNTHNIVLGPYSTRTGTGYYAGIAINGLMNYNGGTSYDVAPHIWIGAQYRDTPGSERSDFVVAVKSGTGTSGTGSDLPEPRFRVDYEGIATATGSFRAPVFYDSENTGYFLDPNGSSQLNTVYAGALYGSDVYTNGGWFRNHSNNNGIYWSNTGWHLMPENGSDFRFHSGSNSDSAIRMETNGTTRGYVYANSSNEIGFLNNGRSWRLRVYSGGAVESYGDFRAPIFYDSNDTNYYLDPNAGANLYGGNGSFTIQGTWPQLRIAQNDGTPDASINYDAGAGYRKWNVGPGAGQAEGNEFGFAVYENTRGTLYTTPLRINAITGYVQIGDKDDPAYQLDVLGTGYASGDFRAPIFYDSADTGYYVDPNSYSRIYRTSTHLAPSPGVGSSNWVNDFNATPTSSMSFGGDLSSGGPQGTWWFQQNFRHSNSSNYWGTQIAWGWEDNANELWQRNVTGGNWSGWVRYLNSNNYGAYAVPITGTVLTEGNYFYFRSNRGSYLGSLDSPSLQAYATGGNAAFMTFHRAGSYAVNFGLDADNVMRIGGWSAAANRWVLDMSGNNTVAGSFRAPIFYSSVDTNYFWEPNVSSAHRFRTANGYVDIGPMNGSWCHFQTDRANFYFGSTIYADASGFATYGGSTSMTKTDINSPIFLVPNHSDNTKGYRIYNTSNSSVSAMFTNSSNQLVIAAGALDQINLNKKVYVNGVALGVNVAPSGTAGRIDASNDIVAYSSSDERLKENITPIENALDKVKSLTGVEFDWKPEYKHAHGYEGHDTGIIAQQVQAVMPSAVRTNDTGFLAVRYEKLIGLLIEANKELAARVEELEKKIG